MDIEVGERLRAERRRQGLSLRELAGRVGVSASMLSQVENGRSRASVSTMYALVNALGISLDDLFSRGRGDEPAGEGEEAGSAPDGVRALRTRGAASVKRGRPVVRAGERARIELETGVVWERLGHSDPDVLQFIEVTYPPGGRSSQSGRFNQHAGIDCCYVLSGRLTLNLGFERYDLGPGDSAVFDAAEPHLLENAGPDECRAIWFIVRDDVPLGAAPSPVPPVLRTTI